MKINNLLTIINIKIFLKKIKIFNPIDKDDNKKEVKHFKIPHLFVAFLKDFYQIYPKKEYL
jgi:hypothetical protein